MKSQYYKETNYSPSYVAGQWQNKKRKTITIKTDKFKLIYDWGVSSDTNNYVIVTSKKDRIILTPDKRNSTGTYFLVGKK